MGGLKKFMPSTYRTQLIAALAIAGVPPLAGFFSKDGILWGAFSGGSTAVWIVGWVTAGLTAFYMFRMMTLVFDGERRFGPDIHPHEAPATMLVPLVILAFASAVGGFLGLPHALGGGNLIGSWLEPVFDRSLGLLPVTVGGSISVEYLLMAMSVGIGLGGIFLARKIYLAEPGIAERAAKRFAGVHRVLSEKYFIDEIYDAVIVRPLEVASRMVLWKGIDVGVIDGAVNGTARLVAALAGIARKIQTGNVSNYGMAALVGVGLVLGILIFR